jgi:hypothetical protein
MDDQVKMHQVFCETFGIDDGNDDVVPVSEDEPEEIEELLPF